MPRVSRFHLAPLDYCGESLGQRLARFRLALGLSQTQVANLIGIAQGLVSDYERDCLRLSADMAVRFAIALQITTDDLLWPSGHTLALSVHRPAPAVVAPVVVAIDAVDATGRARLTRVETIVLGYLERAFTNREIALETGRRESTIKAYVASILAKRGVSSRRELALDRPKFLRERR